MILDKILLTCEHLGSANKVLLQKRDELIGQTNVKLTFRKVYIQLLYEKNFNDKLKCFLVQLLTSTGLFAWNNWKFRHDSKVSYKRQCSD